MDQMGKIADISKWQGNINWSEAAKELDLVILRASCGTSEDTKYERNVNACIENGIPFGAYHYVKAGTAADAVKEAQVFLKVTSAKKHKPAFYIADIEYEAQTKTTTEAVCVAFLQALRDGGCEKIGLYINTRYNWAGKAIGMCDIMWIPHWGKNDGNVPDDKYKSSHPHDLWQYTSKGSLAGVSGNVDLNQLTGTKPLSYFVGSGENGEEKPGPSGEDAGHPHRQPGQMAAHRAPGPYGERSPLPDRKESHGPAPVPPGGGGGDHSVLWGWIEGDC